MGEGTLAGGQVATIGTYWSVISEDGSLYGEGQGVVMAPDGGGGSWSGTGAGKFTGPGGAVSFRGAVFFDSSQAPLSKLDGVACAFEWDVDADGKGTWNIWEWK